MPSGILFKNALIALKKEGATVIDSVEIPNLKALSQNQWRNTFRKDQESFLANDVKRDSPRTLEDFIRIGSTSQYAKDNLQNSAEFSGRWGATHIVCLDTYNDPHRTAFKNAIEHTMDSLGLDALVYPSWNFKPAHLERVMAEYKGGNSQIITPHTGQPAFAVHMGYT